MPNYILGFDGGGTSCRAAVASADGRILGRGKSGAANILTDPDTALVNIVDAARAAYTDAGIDPAHIASATAVLGLAGNNVGDAVHYVEARLPFAKAEIVSDVLIALEGALPAGDGAVASLGTGTVYVVRRNETVSYIGGWGFAVGDLGSGARLGQALLQESILTFDGIHPSSPLTEAVMAEFDDDPRAVVDFARKARPGDLGRYAPRLFAFADKGDAVAIALLTAATTSIDETLDVVVKRGGKPICLLGGLAGLYRPWIAARHQSLFVGPLADALTGSVALAARQAAAVSEMTA
ncbi:N-acetylglucosamine kinase [Pararhizobium antarcticum]|uniref:N-acetylglucosamine kinase n=1 Tax=Pararhizobium antarcticum TaxID=1798805 RepID=A0A657LRD2_9HYPH|nr:N-acetylglucosamine kinase [Pararhizobium antarcticum]OJF94964.1 N-acetylglucosamine kinase [Pararhizobium antarcticum]OJF97466.1 N-acetylglucosamine kinase [Rhizobium sp. 58]